MDSAPDRLEQGGLVELSAVREDFDTAVMATPDVDRFCSSTSWILPAHEAFHADEAVVAARLPDGFLALARGEAPGVGPFLAPLEAMWGLACPIVGPRPEVQAAAALEVVSQVPGWRLLWLSGVVRDGALFGGVVRAVGRRAELRLGPVTQRFRASLDGGFDGWLGRRSALFRKRIRAALRWAATEVELEWVEPRPLDATEAKALFERIHAVETRSWKGREGTGFVTGDMRRFYETMVPDLARSAKPAQRGGIRQGGEVEPVTASRLRVLFARRDGEDIGVCFGGVLGGTYRGLQNSFDDRFREHSLGNVLQAETIRRLCDEGVETYDLGSGMDYKARWAEEIFETVTLLVIRRLSSLTPFAGPA